MLTSNVTNSILHSSSDHNEGAKELPTIQGMLMRKLVANLLLYLKVCQISYRNETFEKVNQNS